jgi:methionyl-tRNA formyltransferase
MKIIFLSKDNDAGHQARRTLGDKLPGATIEPWFAKAGDRLPERADWSCDLLISYLCPRIISGHILEQAGTAINFHPAPPEYPGFGCYNFAIHDGAAGYGATCHRMAAVVDSGEIHAVRRFAVDRDMNPDTLQQRTLAEMYALFVEVLETLAAGRALEVVAHWTRPPTTRKDFEALREVPLDASAEDIERCIRAFAHPDHDGAYIRLHGHDFVALPLGKTTR